jgi:hypothetical protein
MLEAVVLQFDGVNDDDDDANDDKYNGRDDDGDDDDGNGMKLSNLKKLQTVSVVLCVALALTPVYLGGARVGREVLGATDRVKVCVLFSFFQRFTPFFLLLCVFFQRHPLSP